jgi:WD40-like Beta Propeller Repeat
MWLCSRRGGTADRQLHRSTRSATTVPWSTPLAVDALNVAPDNYTGDAWPSPDGKLLYYATVRPGGEGAPDLWSVERLTPTTFGTPVPLAELNDSTAQHDPWLSPDQRVIYFGSRVNGAAAIMTSTR